MTMQNHVAAALASNLQMLKTTIADLSDADLLVRPVPNANHTLWQIGHMICSETRLITAVTPGAMPALPSGFEARFTKDTACIDDPAAFPRRSELLALFDQQRKASIAWAKALTEKDLDTPTPERMRSFIPTVAALLLLLPTHLAMHLGQIQVTRRKLNKPVLF